MECPLCEQHMIKQTITSDHVAPWGEHSQTEEDLYVCEGCGHQELCDDEILDDLFNKNENRI